MALGKPAINVPRGKTYDVHAFAAALDAVNKRLAAIEAILNDLPTQTQQALLQRLTTQEDGYVVKQGPKLITRKIVAGSGVTVNHGDGKTDNTSISSP